MKEKKLWLSPKETATWLGISMATIYRYINLAVDPIPCYKISESNIRIEVAELEKWVKSHQFPNPADNLPNKKKK